MVPAKRQEKEKVLRPLSYIPQEEIPATPDAFKVFRKLYSSFSLVQRLVKASLIAHRPVPVTSSPNGEQKKKLPRATPERSLYTSRDADAKKHATAGSPSRALLLSMDTRREARGAWPQAIALMRAVSRDSLRAAVLR